MECPHTYYKAHASQVDFLNSAGVGYIYIYYKIKTKATNLVKISKCSIIDFCEKGSKRLYQIAKIVPLCIALA